MNLNFKEKITKIETITKAQSGIAYLRGVPGVGKTAILKSIAKKNGWAYFDLRLSQKDEAEVAGLPYKETDENGITSFSYALPKWALEANKRPTLVVFEELNRAPLRVRNAALQLLNERQIGESFFFNENVYMAATGNTGDDGCEVEEFDNALWNRIVLFDYELSIDEWVDYFAKENVKKEIVAFIKAFPEHFYRAPSEKEHVFATPRSWTFLSNMIIKTLGKDATIKEMIPLVTELAVMYVGSSATRFIRYLKDSEAITIDDIINRYDQVKEDVQKMSRDRISEMIVNLKTKNLFDFTKEQIDNLLAFFKICDDDEVIGYIQEYFDMEAVMAMDKSPKVVAVIKQLNPLIKKMNTISKKGMGVQSR